MVDKNSLENALKHHIVTVSFTKVDGSTRDMRCTLKEGELPKIEQTAEPKRIKKTNENVLAVWDLDKQAFRSFRLDSVTGYAIRLHE